MIGSDFLALPDLALRSHGGSVIAANDEFFAEKENLVTAGPAVFNPSTFGHKGQIYDGWETRRRRSDGHDPFSASVGGRRGRQSPGFRGRDALAARRGRIRRGRRHARPAGG